MDIGSGHNCCLKGLSLHIEFLVTRIDSSQKNLAACLANRLGQSVHRPLNDGGCLKWDTSNLKKIEGQAWEPRIEWHLPRAADILY